MTGRGWMAAALIVTAVPTAAQAQTSVQQDFEAATKASDAKDWTAALPAWEALERRVDNNPRSLSLVRLRKASVLLALDRRDEAANAAEAGLEAIPTGDASLRRDRYDAHIVLARIATSALDYASAHDQFAAARAVADDANQRLATWWGLIETGTFVDPQAAATLDATYPQVTEGMTLSDELTGQILTTRAQLYLNLGRAEEARTMARDAVEALGGLTSQTDLDDVAARSMAGLAALRLGDRDDARRYFALTGAGRSATGTFSAPVQMQPPACGGDSGLDPQDVAVIEFSVGSDGSVFASSPIWASRQGDAALIFARAARDWSWTPEQFARLPAFFRNRVRVEMRCSTAFARPSLMGYAQDALTVWLEGKGVAPLAAPTAQARAGAGLRTQLTALDAAGKGATLEAVPILNSLAGNATMPREDRHGWAVRMAAILSDKAAPPLARLSADLNRWANEDADGDNSKRYERSLRGALGDARYAEDAEARGIIALLLSDAAPPRDRATARSYAARVAADAALPANHPLKVGALIRTASLDYQDGKIDAAQAAFEKTGLGAEQCALLDAAPQRRKLNSSSADFPREAQFWGMEGWTKVQYDIAADGDTRNARVVLAYPPFVFSDSSAKVIDRSQYEASFRPGNTLGCGGLTQGVNFQLPS